MHAKPPYRGRHRRPARLRLALAGPVIGLALAAGCASAPPVDVESLPTAKPATPQPMPAPSPSPDGTFSGSCDYTLPADLDGDYTLIGDIDAVNTGNIGIEVKVTIKWLQMGYDPITASETVKVKAGASKTIRFAETVSGNVIDRVQSYQLNHMDEQSCKYDGVMLNTFGEVKS